MTLITSTRNVRRELRGVVALLAVVTGAGLTPASQAGELYFADIFNPTFDDGSIRRINTDGSGLTTLLTTGSGLRGLNVDTVAGHLYWTDVNSPSIRRANLDGSSPQTVLTGGMEFPSAIAVDHAANRMFWGDQLTNDIRRAHLDGSTPEVLRSTAFHRGVTVDPANGKVYWTTSPSLTKGEILRSNYDGSGFETVVSSLNPEFKPADVAIDPVGGKVYWTDYVVDVVRRANLDGTDIQDLYFVGANRNPRGIALDIAGGKLYWGQDDAVLETFGSIMRMNLDGSFPEVVASGLGLVNDLVYVVPEPATLAFFVVVVAGMRRRG